MANHPNRATQKEYVVQYTYRSDFSGSTQSAKLFRATAGRYTTTVNDVMRNDQKITYTVFASYAEARADLERLAGRMSLSDEVAREEHDDNGWQKY